MAKCTICEQETFHYTVRGDYVECKRCSRAPVGYQPFKAYWDEHISEKPVYIENDRQRERIMRQGGLEVRARPHIDDLNHGRWKKGLPPVRE